MPVELSPYAGEPELGDPAYAGEFAVELAKVAIDGPPAPWCTYLARRDHEMVGTGVFKTAPDNMGLVEIGYLTFPSARRTGVATAVVGGLVDIARQHGASAVRAHTLPETNPSTRALETNRFAKIADVVDPDDGPVWRWERSLAEAGA